MKQIHFDLGQKHGPFPESPCGCNHTKEEEKHYPAFHYDGKEKLDVPHEGVMTIRYKKTHSAMSDSEHSGKRYSCTVEVREVISVESDEPEAPTKNRRETEDALDKIKSEMKESY